VTTDDDLPGVVNLVSGGTTGPVVQTGVHVGDVNLFTGVPVQTRYHKQVERIAPADLEGRDAELAELAAFCTSPAGGYAWWRAAAWSGKTALLSWFVLHPPEGVRLVSFFITARYAGQNTRDAFIRNVMEQLLDLTGQQPPVFLDDTNRETHLLGLLDDATAACAKRGEHFVLLVDGLDEDRGVDTHSIAALLPADLHVVVAGRPDPVLPADVPEHHPLRNPAIVRHLAPSPKAQVIRVEAERELRGLLHGGPAGLDVLGLVTVAVGGLTPADLSALTDLSEWEVADLLTTAAGRSFTRRRTSSGGADVYLLGHEELQATAVTVLGPARLERYRQRLHTWADGYRDQAWPVTTPDYLLRGYFAVLTETGDVARMVSCATDIARQDRILAQSGGDGSSLDEIAAAQAVTTDVVASLRLAVHHDYLGHRNATIPPDLPAAWMAAGRPDRATATARSIVDPFRRAEALVAMAKASADDSPTDLLAEAQKAIGSIRDSWKRSALLASLAEAAADHGDPDRAETLIGLAAEPKDQVSALAHVALRADDERRERLLSWAATLLPSIPDPQTRHRRLKSLLTTAAAHGDLDRVTLLARDLPREEGLPFLTVAAVRRGDAGHAEELVRGATDPAERVDLLLGMATTGGPRAARWIAEARSAASTVDNQGGQAKALLLVAEAAATRGEGDLAAEALAAGVGIARDLGDQWLCRLTIHAAAAMGDFTRAAELTRLIRPAGSAVRLLIEVASRAAEAGHADRAAELFTMAERTASSVTGIPFTADGLLEEVARAVVESGDTRNAARIAQSTRYPVDVARLLVVGARTAIRAGDPARAASILEDAEALVRGNTGQAWLAITLDRLVAALATALDLARAMALVSSVGRDLSESVQDQVVRAAGVLFADSGAIDLVGRVQGWYLSPFDEVRVLSHVARVIARNGDHDLASRTLVNAKHVTTMKAWGYEEIHALMQVADAMIDIGDHAGTVEAVHRGESVLRSLINDPVSRMVALSAMAPVVEKVRLFDRAAALNAEAEQLWRSLSAGQRRAVEAQQPRRRGTRVEPFSGSVLDVLRSGQWHQAVPSMTAAKPEVFDVLAAELSAVVRVPPTD